MATVSTYDLEPLRRRPTFGDVLRFERAFGISWRRRIVTIGILVALGVAACALGLLFVGRVIDASAGAVRVFAPAVLGLWMVLLLWGYVWWLRVRMRDMRLAAFASANGLAYVDRVDSEGMRRTRRVGTGFPSSMRNIEQALVGHPTEFPGSFDIARNFVTQPTGSDRVNIRMPFVFAEIVLPTTVPHIVLKNSRSRIIPMAGQGLGNRKRLSLEGDFDKHFTLYCPEGYERDALYIFTPDVMAAVIDTARDAEVELVDDRLYVYMKHKTPLWRAESMGTLLGLIDTLNHRFGRQTTNYSDDRTDAAGRVSLAGRRVVGTSNTSRLTWLWMAGVVLLSAGVMAFSLFVVPNL